MSLRLIVAMSTVLLMPLTAGAANCASKNLLADILQVEARASIVITPCADEVLRTELPDTMFGFNVQHYGFQHDLFDVRQQKVPEPISDSLRVFPGALYRYPGGLVSNRFPWQLSVGPVKDRPDVKSVKWDFPAKILFGVDEYLSLVDDVGGQPWFVLNLVGWDELELFTELDSDLVAETNARLAAHVLGKVGRDQPRYYQLGNELDRSDYQWSHQKYIERSRDSIKAMQAVDPDAHFVAFLREFDWKYRRDQAERGISRYQTFIRDVLTELPMVNDFSMHFYYDARNGQRVTQRMPWRLRQFRLAIEEAKQVRNGVAPNVWITEHARGIEFNEVKARDARPYTSNLSAAISTADFLIAIAQIPEVQGASWHGLNAMPWQMFNPQQEMRPSAVYWAMRVLRKTVLPQVYATYTSSPNSSVYPDGYDVRAVVMSTPDKKRYGVWAANRVAASQFAELVLPEMAGRRVEITHYYIAGEQGVDPDLPDSFPVIMLEPTKQTNWFDKNGRLALRLPPSSVSGFELQPLEPQ